MNSSNATATAQPRTTRHRRRYAALIAATVTVAGATAVLGTTEAAPMATGRATPSTSSEASTTTEVVSRPTEPAAPTSEMVSRTTDAGTATSEPLSADRPERQTTTSIAAATSDVPAADPPEGPPITEAPSTSTEIATQSNAIEPLDPPAAPTSSDPCVPVAANDYYSVPQGDKLAVPFEARFTANDITCEGALLILVVGTPSHGALTFPPGAGFEYVPDPGFTGFDSFQYHYEDIDQVVIASAEVSIWVSPSCLLVAEHDEYTTDAGVALAVPMPGFFANDTFGGCPAFDVLLIPAPGNHGVITSPDPPTGEFEYVPPPGFVGTDTFLYVFTTFEPCPPDSDVLCTAAKIGSAVITIKVVQPCVAVDDAYTVADDVLSVAPPGALANDTLCADFDHAELAQPAAHGTVLFDSDGGFTYQPQPGYVGGDSFTYGLIDTSQTGDEVLASATVRLDVIGGPPCEVSLVDDAYQVTAGETLHVSAPGPAANDTLCPGADELKVVSAPAHGALTLLTGGDLTYTPDAGFSGIDSFTYSVAQTPVPSGFAGAPRPLAPVDELVATVTIDVIDAPPTNGGDDTTTTTTTTTTAPGGDATTTTATATTPSTMPSPGPSGELPATGGGATVLITLIAGMLLAAGAIVTVTSRRSSP